MPYNCSNTLLLTEFWSAISFDTYRWKVGGYLRLTISLKRAYSGFLFLWIFQFWMKLLQQIRKREIPKTMCTVHLLLSLRHSYCKPLSGILGNLAQVLANLYVLRPSHVMNNMTLFDHSYWSHDLLCAKFQVRWPKTRFKFNITFDAQIGSGKS